MKSLSLALLALVGSAAAFPVVDNDGSYGPFLERRQTPKGSGAAPKGSGAAPRPKSGGGNMIAGLVTGMLNSGYGRVPDPAGAAPRVVNLPARIADIAGSKTIKLRYGPYKVPNMGHKNAIGEAGALWNYPDQKIDKPCAGECTILGLNAGLEYPDGSNANIDTGMWLHHFVLFNVGPGRQDATCLNNATSLPHMLIGSSPKGSERLFSSGNERTPAFMPKWNEKNVGYFLRPADKFAFIVDLMNENMEDKVVYLTITYDILNGHPAGYDEMRPVWFDAAQCLTSEVKAPKQDGQFVITAPRWTANFDGEVLGAAGHLHDGGDRITLEADGKLACDSKATYGGDPAFINTKPGMGGGGHHASATEHISHMSICAGPSFLVKTVKKGQAWDLKGYYDYDKYKGMRHEDGAQSNVMGIAIMFVRVKKAVA
ncbi:hypothetical protein EJ06DRAFT_527256 [Trichodelitschia bisporula]|uniref:Uncharacterized protein n=1 Tax=Trichodelitschia bisporula TaxID=703511 RepID=A0A6G1I6A7_9PEZI|nr:hypothetical protein EJ06DRAFT_527256 [Trichodelitschia bisporula]